MIALCEKCFPGWKDVEVLSIVPLGPCDQCGIYDNREKPDGISVHAFRKDPRKPDIAGAFSSASEQTKAFVHEITADFYYRDGTKHVDGSMGSVKMSPGQIRDCLAFSIEQRTIEGVPIKDVMIDAICGADCNLQILNWAKGLGLAIDGDRPIGKEWDRAALGMLELDALFAIYGRQKRL